VTVQLIQPIQGIVVERFLQNAGVDRLIAVFAALEIPQNVKVIFEILNCGSTAQTGGDRF
jgi:hypothetical protein